MRRVILAVESDTHGGHKLGLLNPETILYDETEEGEIQPYTPELTAAQRYLWELREENISKVTDLAGDDEIIYFHNGDPTQGNKYPDQLVSTRMADQVLIAAANIRPWAQLSNVKTIRLSFSTSSHVFGEGSADILITTILSKEFPELDIRCLYHGLADIDGLRIDYAHHGPTPGGRKWLEGNMARYYLRDIMLSSLVAGQAPPALVLRGHYHEYIHEVVTVNAGDCEYASRIVITPSMCMIGDYGRQATKSKASITNGMVAFEIVDGEILRVHRYARTLDIRTKETL